MEPLSWRSAWYSFYGLHLYWFRLRHWYWFNGPARMIFGLGPLVVYVPRLGMPEIRP